MPLFFKFNDVVAALFHAIYRQLTGTPSPIATPIPISVVSSFESLDSSVSPCDCADPSGAIAKSMSPSHQQAVLHVLLGAPRLGGA